MSNFDFVRAALPDLHAGQMLGRGTRLRPDLYGPRQDKTDFFVLDFCGNLEFFGQDLPGSEGSTQKSLTQRIVEHRVALLRALGDSEPELRRSTADLLHEFVSGMHLDNVLIRPHRRAVEQLGERSAWDALTDEGVEAALSLAGLPSAVSDPDEAAKRFDLLVLRRQLAQLEGDGGAAERVRETVQALAGALLGQTAIPSVAAQAVLLEAVAGDEWWIDVTLPMLEHLRLRMRGLVQFVGKTPRNPIYTDFEDTLGDPTRVDLPGTTPGMSFERFRAKAQAYLREHESHVSLQRLRRNRQLTGEDLSALEEMLVAAGAGEGELARASKAGGLGLFVRSLVGLDRAAANEAFAEYLDAERFTVDQVRFVGLIIEELTANGTVEPDRLYESPFTDHAPTGPDQVFPSADVDVIFDRLAEIKRHAVAEGA